ncbi:uncharacterized protein LOC126576837 [Anopheles aquasalis]|uniref:uncharacterized protein LOC126576837 n=1 Tax=Anopheles aquasalis TaxID=42839 RepID=UPI00215B678A|nr:uncharacterized protein LOC126576837 [Anopheles aquasalis]
MKELRFLNVFNYLFVAPTYLTVDATTRHYIYHRRNNVLNTVVLTTAFTVFVSAGIFVALNEYFSLTSSVIGSVTIILYTTRILVMAPLIFWTLVCNRLLLEVFNRALVIERAIQQLRPYGSSTFNLGGLRALLMEVTITLATLGIEWGSNCYFLWKDETIEFATELDEFKRQIASTTSFFHILYVLDALVKCSSNAYTIFFMIDNGIRLEMITSDIMKLILDGSLFFLYTYRYNFINQKSNSDG